MSIEENLQRIADSNDKIVELLGKPLMNIVQGVDSVTIPAALNEPMDPPTPEPAPVVDIPAPPAVEQQGPAVTEVPTPDVVITLETLNDEALAAVKRVGDNGAKVYALLAEYGAKTLNQVAEDKHSEIYAKLQAL